MDNLQCIKDNIKSFYQSQSNPILYSFEYQAIWSYLDRLIDMQVINENVIEARRYNDYLFSQYREKEIIKWKKN